MSSSFLRLAKRYWLAALFGLLHALLGGTAVAIQLLDAWNDMNPTMIVAVLFHFVDYPLFVLAGALAGPNVWTTQTVILVAIVGTGLWSLIGYVVQSVWHAVGHRPSRRLGSGNGAG